MGGSQEKIVEDAAKAVAAAEQAETQAASMRELAQVKPILNRPCGKSLTSL